MATLRRSTSRLPDGLCLGVPQDPGGETDVKKNCPKCRVETRSDADWCWYCGYSYEEEDARQQPKPAEDVDTAQDTTHDDTAQ
jgi:hypothetical protein